MFHPSKYLSSLLHCTRRAGAPVCNHAFTRGILGSVGGSAGAEDERSGANTGVRKGTSGCSSQGAGDGGELRDGERRVAAFDCDDRRVMLTLVIRDEPLIKLRVPAHRGPCGDVLLGVCGKGDDGSI